MSRDGGRTYPARHARRLPADPPGQPCTVPVYSAGTGTGRILALDFDLGRARGAGDPAAEVATQAAVLAELVAGLGGQVLADVVPAGGRHVFIVFAAALPWLELRDLARAISLRYPAVDPAPMSGLGGQISPPGARHKSGGWRLLSMPVEAARAAAENPCGPGVWDGLLTEFAAELQQIEEQDADSAAAVAGRAELDGTGVPWVPRPGGRAPLAAELDQVARTGRWDHTRYPGRSQARMAVVGAAAVRGWQLADIRAAVASGRWKGLAALYERRSEPGRMERLLPLEWRKCVGGISREENVRHWHTSDSTTRPPRR